MDEQMLLAMLLRGAGGMQGSLADSLGGGILGGKREPDKWTPEDRKDIDALMESRTSADYDTLFNKYGMHTPFMPPRD